jgi:hypothetical protein
MLSAVPVGGGACGTFAPDLTEVIQITVVVADSVVVTDTLFAHATAANAHGDTVSAAVIWTSFDTLVLAVADSTAGVFVGRQVGSANIQARAAGNLRSNPINIRVTALPTP